MKISSLILMINIHPSGSDSSDFSENDALKMLHDDLLIITKTSTDLVSLSCRVYIEALAGHLTRPPE